MLNRKGAIPVISTLLISLMLTLGPLQSAIAIADQKVTIAESTATAAADSSSVQSEEDSVISYHDYRNDAVSKFHNAPASFTPIVLQAAQYSNISDSSLFTTDGSDTLVWNDGSGWIEWKVDIPADGLYNLALEYDSANTQLEDIVRGVQIDGQLPFEEAERVRIKRAYKMEQFPPARDSFNNEIRPSSIEVPGWKTEKLANYDVDSMPLLWSLSKGEHTIRLIGVGQPMKLKQLSIIAPYVPSSYADAGDSKQSVQNGTWSEIIEAENFARKSNPSIQIQSTDTALMSPDTKGGILYNSLGGEEFKQAGQWVEWDFTVPKDGVYHIGFKYFQSYLNNFSSYRVITIDGLPLYKETQEVAFPYGTQWHGLTLSNDDGKPLNIPLKKGKHTIRMTNTAAPSSEIYKSILGIMDTLVELDDSIRKITGNFDKSLNTAGNIDLNRDWDLEKYIPDLKQQMDAICDDMLAQASALHAISHGVSDTENSLKVSAKDLRNMRNHIRQIPNELNKIEKMRANLSSWLFRMLDQPIMFDYLWIADPGAETPKTTPNVFQRLSHAVVALYRTFTIDYSYKRDNPNAIDVWVNRNRDYVNLIQQLSDQTFTQKTGIEVNVNIVPDPSMFLLGNAAGIQPDVALNVDMAMPVDFASRGALVDLSKFPDYKEVAKNFRPGAMRVFHYNGGDYALPEVQLFDALVYRKDILKRLNLDVPNTWTDVSRITRTLQQNGYDFYVNPVNYVPFILQNGAKFYSPDGMKSALDSDAAYKGFKQWTDLFTLYQFPKEVPSFFNHFRLGDIPIGIADSNTILQIQFAAPELAGNWGIAPVPGTVQPDGSVARWDGGGLWAGFIYSKSKKQNESWEFLKWWTSTETQQRFGNEIESIYGPQYRWPTSNVKAFDNLPWPSDQLAAIREQLKWYSEVPQVPGGYFTPRQIAFAWNNIVVSGKNVRASLDTAVIDVNREMKRKQTEFGLRDTSGKVIDPLDIPPLIAPSNKEEGP